MARNNIAVRKSYAVRLATAHDNRNGDGASLIVRASLVVMLGPTGQVVREYHAGIEIERIRIQPLMELPDDTLVRLFIDAPGQGRFLLHEQRMFKGTHPHALWPHESGPPFGPADLRPGELNGPWSFQPGQALMASCATMDPFDVIAFGGEYTE